MIYGYEILSAAAAAVPYFNNGTATVNTIAFRGGPTTAAQAAVVSIPAPVMLPGGCYVSFDANTTEVTVFYVLQSTSS